MVPVHSATTVVILQHPLEVKHAKNTARLLHMGLPNSHLLVGESWAEQALTDVGLPPQPTLLLYPRTTPAGQQPGVEPPGLTAGIAPLGLPYRLLVLDATWRKSRKMLHLSPWLQTLPRLALDEVPASRYTMRKAHSEGQLSTLEATCAALALLDGDGARFAPLLRGFDGFVAQQLARMPRLPER